MSPKLISDEIIKLRLDATDFGGDLFDYADMAPKKERPPKSGTLTIPW